MNKWYFVNISDILFKLIFDPIPKLNQKIVLISEIHAKPKPIRMTQSILAKLKIVQFFHLHFYVIM